MTQQPYNLVEKLRLTSLQTWHVQRPNGAFYRDDLPFEAADRIEELESEVRRYHQHSVRLELEAHERALSHDDLCRLSRVFVGASDLRTQQDIRINAWLKKALGAPTASPAAGPSHRLDEPK